MNMKPMYDGERTITVFLLVPERTAYAELALSMKYRARVEKVFAGPDNKQFDRLLEEAREALQKKANKEKWFFSPDVIVRRFLQDLLKHPRM